MVHGKFKAKNKERRVYSWQSATTRKGSTKGKSRGVNGAHSFRPSIHSNEFSSIQSMKPNIQIFSDFRFRSSSQIVFLGYEIGFGREVSVGFRAIRKFYRIVYDKLYHGYLINSRSMNHASAGQPNRQAHETIGPWVHD